MIDIAPKPVIAVTAFGNEAVDMGVPFQIPAECMEDHDEAGSKVHGLVLPKEHTGDNAVYCKEKAVKKGAVIEEEAPQVFINRKDAVTVYDIDQLKRHGSGALHGIKIPAGRAEAAVAAERNKSLFSALWAGIHCSAKSRVTAVDHFFDIFHFTVTWMEGIYNFLKMFSENLL